MKKIFALLLIAALIISLTSCVIPQKESQSASSPSVSSSSGSASSEPSPTPTPEVKYPTEFRFGDVLQFPAKYEITVASPYYDAKIVPPSPGDFYTYYEIDNPENIYADIVVNIKNLQSDGLGADNVLGVSMLYDGKYTYDSFAVIEESGGDDFTYPSIETISCLTTRTLHFLAEVPLEVQNSGKSVQVILSVMGNAYTSTSTPGAGAVVQMSKDAEVVDNPSMKSAKPLSLGGTAVVGDYGELTVLGAEFKKKILPPSPGSFYTYYESGLADCTYLDVVLSFKNLQTSDVIASDVADVTVVYANKYEYSTFSIIEDGGDFTYTNITNIAPLTSGTIHYLVEVPQTIVDDAGSVIALLKMGGEIFSYQVK